MDGYTRRYVDDYLDRAMQHLPAFMITGARACGKTTTALQRAGSVLRLDAPADAALFAGDPDATLERLPAPVLLDEWQEVPASLAAVKRAVDAAPVPGQFLVTGSARSRHTGTSWPGTGRMTPVRMYPMAEGEKNASADAAAFIERLFASDVEPGRLPNAPTIYEYVDMVVSGGFPQATALPDEFRSAWYAGYIAQLAGRDLPDIAAVRDPQKVVATLTALALSTAGTPAKTTLAQAVGVDHRTLDRYIDLLTEVGVVDVLPAWGGSRLANLGKSPKMHLTDTGLAAHLAGVDAESLLVDGDLRGRMLESFVAAQLRPLLALGSSPIAAAHLRDANNRHEVDLILEGRRGKVVAIEVKAAAGADRKDAAHLTWLRDRLHADFVAGVVFHTGNLSYAISDRIWAMPIAAMWA